MERPVRRPDLLHGAFAGAAGGLAGGIVKMLCERFAPPRPEGREAPPAVMMDRLAVARSGEHLTEDEKQSVTLTIHYAFSVLASAGYGALAEFAPVITTGFGTGYGLAVWAGAHEYALPRLDLTPRLPELPVSEQVNEAVTHALFGSVVEGVRRAIRRAAAPSVREEPAPNLASEARACYNGVMSKTSVTS